MRSKKPLFPWCGDDIDVGGGNDDDVGGGDDDDVGGGNDDDVGGSVLNLVLACIVHFVFLQIGVRILFSRLWFYFWSADAQFEISTLALPRLFLEILLYTTYDLFLDGNCFCRSDS